MAKYLIKFVMEIPDTELRHVDPDTGEEDWTVEFVVAERLGVDDPDSVASHQIDHWDIVRLA